MNTDKDKVRNDDNYLNGAPWHEPTGEEDPIVLVIARIKSNLDANRPKILERECLTCGYRWDERGTECCCPNCKSVEMTTDVVDEWGHHPDTPQMVSMNNALAAAEAAMGCSETKNHNDVLEDYRRSNSQLRKQLDESVLEYSHLLRQHDATVNSLKEWQETAGTVYDCLSKISKVVQRALTPHAAPHWFHDHINMFNEIKEHITLAMHGGKTPEEAVKQHDA